MKIFISCFLVLFFWEAGAQSFRYSNIVFEKTDTLKNIEYASADWLYNPVAILSDYNIHEGEVTTETRPLLMDIYTPSGDTVKQRPAIIFMHSGGFLLGTRHNDDMIALCDSFARRGYVTVTIDYRIGMGATVNRFFGIVIGAQVDQANGYRAFYRAMQDSRAAIRFLKLNAENFGIDTTKIFLFGSSAGAILGIQNLYLDKKEEIDPAAFNAPSLSNFDTIGSPGFGAKADAVVALWGSLQKPELIKNENTPIFLAHGTADDIVPFKKGKLLGNIEIPIPSIKLELPDGYGSFCIDTALQNRGIQHQNYFVEGKKHEFYGVDTGEFPEDGPNAYWDTIIWKTSNFLFEVFKPDAEFEYNTINTTAVFINSSDENFSVCWNFGDNTTGIGNSLEHAYEKPGLYKVMLTVCNKNLACDTISKWIEIGEHATINEKPADEIMIIPDYFNKRLNINGLTGKTTVSFFNSQGMLLQKFENVENGTLKIQNLKTGIYIVAIKNLVQKKSIKLVIPG